MMNSPYKITREKQKNKKANEPFEIRFITIVISSLLIASTSIIFMFQPTKTFFSR